ncbi:hypothetical protein ACH5RR_021963 [Cinchona calisaya]|uniref:RNase H type-1 domain-containing protein n=1 Tax=Cinchona calisaya TaxID=153742 RepID=A0ABD2Z6G3_9GENT
MPYHCSILKLGRQFDALKFTHIPRSRNVFADVLATLSSMISHPDGTVIEPITIQVLEKPGYCCTLDAESDGFSWFHDIKEFLDKDNYPLRASTSDKKFLRQMSIKFFLNDNVLYRRMIDLGLLRCVDKK